jgi:hypothetical protein
MNLRSHGDMNPIKRAIAGAEIAAGVDQSVQMSWCPSAWPRISSWRGRSASNRRRIRRMWRRHRRNGE